MIEPHHPVKPLKVFSIKGKDEWGDSFRLVRTYRFVNTYRSCWLWHIVKSPGVLNPSERTYIVECPDERCYYAPTLTEAKMIAGRWSNGDDPELVREVTV